MKWSQAALLAAAAAVATAAGRPAVHGPDPEAFVPMGGIIVPIVDANHVEGKLDFKLVVAARDAAAANRIRAAQTSMRSRAMTAGLEFSRLYATRLSAVDAPKLVAELEKALKQDNDDVARVLLVEVVTKS